MTNSSDNALNAMIKEVNSDGAATSAVERMWGDLSRAIFGDGKYDAAKAELKNGNLDTANPFEVFDLKPAPAAKLDNFSGHGVAKKNWLPSLEISDSKK